MKQIMGKDEIDRISTRMTHELLEEHKGAEDIALVGIHTRGVFLANRMKSLIKELEGADVPTGTIDITLYRDDFKEIIDIPKAKDTDILFDVTEMIIILVDDVLYTGRTARAAIDEIIDFGRPKKIELAVLIDRGNREIPISPTFVGKKMQTSESEFVEVKVNEYDDKDAVLISDRSEQQ